MTKRQARKAQQQLVQEKRNVARLRREELLAARIAKETAKAEQRAAEAAAEAEREAAANAEREAAANAQREQEQHKQHKKEEAAREEKRKFWQKSGNPNTASDKKCPRKTPKPQTSEPRKPKMTVAEGMAQHSRRWDVWAASLPNSIKAPLPHPKLFTKHMSALLDHGEFDDNAKKVAYRELMRQWHPDKVHQSIGNLLNRTQQEDLYPKVAEMCKQINAAFGK